MNGDANVYPTDVPGFVERCSDHDNVGNFTSWQPAGEHEAHEATALLYRDSHDKTLRDIAQDGFRCCPSRQVATSTADSANLLVLPSAVESQAYQHKGTTCTCIGQDVLARLPGSFTCCLRSAPAPPSHDYAQIVLWQTAGEQVAHKALAMPLNAGNKSNTMRIEELITTLHWAAYLYMITSP